ncbi:MAG: PAS domain S-box protein [Chitinophagaceae bacterium]
MKSEFYQSTRKPISFDSNADTSKLISFAENDLLSLADAVIPKEIFSAPGNKNDRLKKIAALIHKNDKSKGLVGIILHDKNGKQVIANKIAERLYNGSKAETINHLWKTGEVLSNNKSVPLENSPFMQALHTGRSQRRSFRILLKNGEQRWLFFHSKPLLEKGETHASGVVSSVIDITNEKQLAHYIEDRNDLVLSFMKETPNPAWIVDEDGRLIFATAAFFSYFNLKEKETIGKNLAELVPPQLYHSLYAKHLKVLNCGKSLKTVEQIKLANGSSFTSYVNLFLIKNGEQKLVAGHSVYLGKSSRIKARQRETKENMLLLSHASSDAIWEWDIMTGRIYQNKALMNLLGYKSTISAVFHGGYGIYILTICLV